MRPTCHRVGLLLVGLELMEDLGGGVQRARPDEAQPREVQHEQRDAPHQAVQLHVVANLAGRLRSAAQRGGGRARDMAGRNSATQSPSASQPQLPVHAPHVPRAAPHSRAAQRPCPPRTRSAVRRSCSACSSPRPAAEPAAPSSGSSSSISSVNNTRTPGASDPPHHTRLTARPPPPPYLPARPPPHLGVQPPRLQRAPQVGDRLALDADVGRQHVVAHLQRQRHHHQALRAAAAAGEAGEAGKSGETRGAGGQRSGETRSDACSEESMQKA